MKKINLLIVKLILFLFVIFCSQPRDYFDFSEFEEAGLARQENKKLLIYINLHNSKSGRFTGLDVSCEMGIPYHLNPYIESDKHDILFLIDVDPNDLPLVEERLVNWCFEGLYLITHNTPDFYQLARSQNVKWISHLFDKDGRLIALTNPSMSNFKDLMKE